MKLEDLFNVIVDKGQFVEIEWNNKTMYRGAIANIGTTALLKLNIQDITCDKVGLTKVMQIMVG